MDSTLTLFLFSSLFLAIGILYIGFYYLSKKVLDQLDSINNLARICRKLDGNVRKGEESDRKFN